MVIRTRQFIFIYFGAPLLQSPFRLTEISHTLGRVLSADLAFIMHHFLVSELHAPHYITNSFTSHIPFHTQMSSFANIPTYLLLFCPSYFSITQILHIAKERQHSRWASSNIRIRRSRIP